ncbi:MAG: aryl-sulfate sulfotransferase [Gemmatimonadales bacterium]|nr:aryl-sulfate sulfotransferase [Gemmatimonadales bacterium]
MRSLIAYTLLFVLFACPALAQGPYPGLTIISLRTTADSYLVDMDFNVVKTWHGATVPTELAYMLPDSSVLRPCYVPLAEGRGGRIQRIDADDTVIWDFLFDDPDNQYLQHHDIEPMPNGNVLLLAWERHSIAEAIEAGRQELINDMKVTYIVEIEPVGLTGGNVVWQWSAWDHLVQEADPTKDNYGVIADHPELIDINFGDVPAGTWLHANAVDYNEELDQIVFSARNISEVYVIDHSTSTAEAAGHTGGRWGRGGDILYRWGNPQTYGRGDANDQVLWGAHGVVWIDESLPGAGNIMVFNNGDNPNTAVDLSSVEEILPPQSEPGAYLIEPNLPFGPASAAWRYGDVYGFLSSTLGGAYRMPNGTTVICEGTEGRVFEVNPDGTIVWVYLGGAPIHRAPRYWEPVSASPETPAAVRLMGNHPNPFNPVTTIGFAVENTQRVTVSVFDVAGGRIATLTDQIYEPGIYSVKWAGRNDEGRTVPSGTYLVQMETGDDAEARKISLVR